MTRRRHPLFYLSAAAAGVYAAEIGLPAIPAWGICWLWYAVAPGSYARSSHQWLASLGMAIVTVWLVRHLSKLIPASLPRRLKVKRCSEVAKMPKNLITVGPHEVGTILVLEMDGVTLVKYASNILEKKLGRPLRPQEEMDCRDHIIARLKGVKTWETPAEVMARVQAIIQQLRDA